MSAGDRQRERSSLPAQEQVHSRRFDGCWGQIGARRGNEASRFEEKSDRVEGGEQGKFGGEFAGGEEGEGEAASGVQAAVQVQRETSKDGQGGAGGDWSECDAREWQAEASQDWRPSEDGEEGQGQDREGEADSPHGDREQRGCSTRAGQF